MKIKREVIEAAVKLLSERLGKPQGPAWKSESGKNVSTVGAWILDYNPTYGGCVIKEMDNEQGGGHHPLGSRRMKPEEFMCALRLVQLALDIADAQRR